MATKEGNSRPEKSLLVSLSASTAVAVWAFLAIHSRIFYTSDVTSKNIVLFVLASCLIMRFATDLFVAVFGGKFKKLSDRRLVIVGCPVVLVLGTVMLTCAANGWMGGLAFTLVGAALCGIGVEIMFLLWYELFVDLDFAMVKKLILLIVASQALTPLLYRIPFEYVFLICLILPLIAMEGYRRSRAYVSRNSTQNLSRWCKLSLVKAAPLLLGVALLYMGFHFFQFGFQDILSGETGAYEVGRLGSLVGGVLAFVVMIFIFKRVNDLRYASIFRTAAIVGIGAFLILPLPFEQSFLIFSITTVVACILTECAVTFSTISIARYSTIKPIRVVAWGRLAMNAGGLLGVAVGSALVMFWRSASKYEYLAIICAASVLLLAIAGIWLLREQAIDSFLWGEASRRDIESGTEDRTIAANSAFLAAEYSLTSRETEVLNLVLAGRSIPFISETLYISPNTAKTHVRHIYQKMDIHSKQELLTLARERGSAK